MSCTGKERKATTSLATATDTLRRLVWALVMQAMRSSVPAATCSADSPARAGPPRQRRFLLRSCNSRTVEALYPPVVISPDRQPHGGRPSRPGIPSTSGSGARGGAAWRRTAAAASAHDDPRLGDGPPRRPTGAGPGPPAGGCSPRRAGFLTADLEGVQLPVAARWPAGLGARQVVMALADSNGRSLFRRYLQVFGLYGPVRSRQVRLGLDSGRCGPVRCSTAWGNATRMTGRAHS